MTYYQGQPAAPKPPRTSESLASSDESVTDVETAPPEYQLAYIDAGALPRGNDVNAARIRYLLKSLSTVTGETPQGIADRTRGCTATLKRDYGKPISNQRFLEEANEYFKSGRPQTDYNSVSTMLIAGLGR